MRLDLRFTGGVLGLSLLLLLPRDARSQACCTTPELEVLDAATLYLSPGQYKMLVSSSGDAHADVFGHPIRVQVEDRCPGEPDESYITSGLWFGPWDVNTRMGLAHGASFDCDVNVSEYGYILAVFDGTIGMLYPAGGIETSVGAGSFSVSWKFDNAATCGYQTFGGAFITHFTDTDNDGDTDEADEARLNAMIGTTNPVGDLNFDGVVDTTDRRIMICEELRHAVGAAQLVGGPLNGAPCSGNGGPHTVTNYPPPATTLTVSQLNSTTLRLSWTATNEGTDDPTRAATSYEVRRSASPISSDATFLAAEVVSSPPTPASPATTQTMDVTLAGSGYFAIRIVDDVGNRSAIATTHFDLPPTKVASLGAATGRNDVKLGWAATGEDSTWGTASAYDIRYRIGSAVTDANWGSSTPVSGVTSPNVAGTQECLVVSSLDECTNYYFGMKVQDATGVWTAVTASGLAKTRCTGGLTHTCDPGLLSPVTDSGLDGISPGFRMLTPNPTRDGAEFELGMPAGSPGETVVAAVYDVSGRTIRKLYGEPARGGVHLAWNLRREDDSRVHAGVYFVRCSTKTAQFSQTVIVQN